MQSSSSSDPHDPETGSEASCATEKSPDEEKVIYYLKSAPKLIAGSTPKEYGLSYQADVEITGENLDYGKLKLDKVLSESPPSLSSIFLKCPEDGSSEQASKDFLAEYENKGLIKFAAERLEESGKVEKDGRVERRPLKVKISRMLGKGTLEISGQPPRSCLIYDFIEGDDLEKYPLPLPGEVKMSKDFLDFALDLATAVQKLHNQGVVHSFIVPRNLVRTQADPRKEKKNEIPEVCLVGFGYARLCDTRGKAGSPLNVLESDKLFRAPECRADSPHSAFWFPADIYSIGAILYYWLARKTPSKVAAKSEIKKDDLDVLRNLSPDVRLLKKTISDTLRKTASHIIEGNENILKILDSCLRFRAEDRFSCVEELIESIKLAISAGSVDKRRGRTTIAQGQSGIDVGAIERWEPVPDHGTTELPPYFYELKHTLAESLKADFTAITSGHYEVYGHRDRIVTSLCHLLASAKPGDMYCTMTLPDYWADDNLGSNGRFLVMNKHMVRQGVNITRLYLVSREFHELSEGEQYILDQQLEAQEDLAEFAKEHEKQRKAGIEAEIKPGKMDIFVLRVEENIIGNFEKDGSMVGFLQKQNGGEGNIATRDEDFVCLNFFSTANVSWINGKEIVKRRIHKVRYWRLNKERRVRFDDNKARFDNYVEDAMTLGRYIRQEEPDMKKFGIKDLRDLIKGPQLKQEV